MEYSEISRREEVIIKTLVGMTFSICDEEIIYEEIEVSHFNPADEAAIILGIENRYITEENKLKIEHGC